MSKRGIDFFNDLVPETDDLLQELAAIRNSVNSLNGLAVDSPPRRHQLSSIPEESLVENLDKTEGIKKKFTLTRPALKEASESAHSDLRHIAEQVAPESNDLARENEELLKENQRLRADLGAFDEEFFEKIQDLKHRYTKLQQVVGELPDTRQYRNASPLRSASGTERGSLRESTSPLPLDRLRSTARRSMTAIDNASMYSSLVGTRPTYDSRDIPEPFHLALSHRGDHGARPFPYTSAKKATGTHSLLEEEDYYDANTVHRDRNGRFRDDDYDLKASIRDRYRRSLQEGSDDMANSDDRTNYYQDFTRKDYLDSKKVKLLPSRAEMEDCLLRSGEAIPVSGARTGSFAKFASGVPYSNSSIYERRLVFELAQSKSPSDTAKSLMHKVIDVAGKGGGGFITVAQLAAIFRSFALQMGNREIELLANGFASNGKGGINAKEFCDAVQSLIYEMLGQHIAAEEAFRQEAVDARKALEDEDDVENILLAIAEGILLRERDSSKGISQPLEKTAKGLYRHIVTPFVVSDEENVGHVSYEAFGDCISRLGANINEMDLFTVAKRYRVKQLSSGEDVNIDRDRTSILDRDLQGTLRASAKLSSSFNKWMATTGIGLDSPQLLIEYDPLVKRLVQLLLSLFESVEPEEMKYIQLPWIMREFGLVDNLLCQLDTMKTGERRRCLMKLQHALASADPTQKGDVDGFSILDALLSSGFKLQRLERIQLLRSIEELGGRVEYAELCQVLLRACADWTEDERAVVGKILTSMGISVFERRSWLVKFRYELAAANANQNRQTRNSWAAPRQLQPTDEDGDADADAIAAGALGQGEKESDGDPGISPSAFLRCLRNCGVDLTIDEEATLLDCLDTERLAEIGGKQIQRRQQEQHSNHRSNGSDQLAASTSWSVPLIYYKSFLLFCSRHCGHWSDISPKLTKELKESCATVHNPVDALAELSELLNALDEEKIGRLSTRQFQVACHRSRLLSALSHESCGKLSQILATEHNGKIDYKSFLLYVRTNCVKASPLSAATPELLLQLLQNATDAANTLLPLRNWLIKHTDVARDRITEKELVALLKHFSVVYRVEDLRKLLTVLRGDQSESEDYSTDTNKQLIHFADHQSKRSVLSSRALMAHVLALRKHWATVHPKLAQRIVKLLSMCGTDRFTPKRFSADSDGPLDAIDSTHSKFMTGSKGIETAAARLILSRLRAFSSIKPIDNTTVKNIANEQVGAQSSQNSAGLGSASGNEGGVGSVASLLDSSRMLEKDLFAHVCRASGLPLSDEDILVLADATDCNPRAERVRCDIIVEAIRDVNMPRRDFGDSQQEIFEVDGTNFAISPESMLLSKGDLSRAALFALKHLRDLIWTTAERLERSPIDWRADVKALFGGFDPSGSGFITTEDFMMALRLLRCPITPDILRDIPVVPDGPGLIAFPEILEVVLQPPKVKSRKATELIGKSDTGAIDDAHYNSHGHGHTSQSGGGKRNPDAKHTVSPIIALLRVIRRSLCSFIVSVDDLEEAWVHLLRAFSRFDPDETNCVNARDFCLAISVLVGDDDLVLTKSDWGQIIEFFSLKEEGKSARQLSSIPVIEYMMFCEAVLDPHELTQTIKTEASSKQLASKTHGRYSRHEQAADPSVSRSASLNESQSLLHVARAPMSTRDRTLHLMRSEINNHKDLLGGSYSSSSSSQHKTNKQKDSANAPNPSLKTSTTGQRSRMTASLKHHAFAGTNGHEGEDNASREQKVAPSMNPSDFHDHQMIIGRNKVRKYHKQSCRKLQQHLRGVSLTTQLQYAIKDLQFAVLSSLEYLLGSNTSTQKTSAYDLIEDRLRSEDRNKGGNLTIQSFYAALGSIGLSHTRIFESPEHKKIVKILEELSGDKGKIILGDFLALIFDNHV